LVNDSKTLRQSAGSRKTELVLCGAREEIMFGFRSSLMIATLGIATALALPASAQYNSNWQNRGWGWQDRDHDYDRDHDRRDHDWNRDRNHAYNQGSQRHAYQEGYRTGIADRNRNRPGHGFKKERYHDRDEQRAYDAGYNAGYNAANGNQGRASAPWWGNRGTNGAYGSPTGGSQAAQIGYQDGMNAAQADVQRGNGYHPHDGNNYRNGDRGYNSSFGNKREYITAYRNAYQQGYDRVYNGSSARRW
jgi:hypothetical protein